MAIFKKAIRNMMLLYYKLCYKSLNDEKIITTSLSKDEINSTLKEWISDLKKSAWKTDSGIVGRYNKYTGILKVNYRFKKKEYVNDDCAYTKYFILARVMKSENNTYMIRYSFVDDHYFRLIQFIILELFAIVLLLFYLCTYNLDHPRLLIIFSVFILLGGFIAFSNKEDSKEAAQVIEIFEKEMELRFQNSIE